MNRFRKVLCFPAESLKFLPFPIYHGSAKNNIGTQQLIEVISDIFCSEMDKSQSELCGSVFKIEYTDRKQRLAYLRLYSGTLHLRDTIILSEKKKMKLTEMYIPSNGEMIQTEIACSGDIVILPNDILWETKKCCHATHGMTILYPCCGQ